MSSHGDSIGTFETRAIHVSQNPDPAAMTHASMAGSPFAVSDSVIRLSVGSEAAEDVAPATG